MMWQSDRDYLVRKERQKDLLREIAHYQLVQAAKRQQPKNQQISRIVATWMGGQMVKWGAKLQTHNAALSAKESIF